jgi:hypothetical protein
MRPMVCLLGMALMTFALLSYMRRAVLGSLVEKCGVGSRCVPINFGHTYASRGHVVRCIPPGVRGSTTGQSGVVPLSDKSLPVRTGLRGLSAAQMDWSLAEDIVGAARGTLIDWSVPSDEEGV